MSLDGSYKKLAAANLQRIEQYVKRIESLLSKAAGRFISLSAPLDYDSKDGQFYFDNFPEVKKAVSETVSKLALGMEQAIITGTSAEWTKGTEDANGILDYVMKKAGIKSTDEISDFAIGKYLNNHESALRAFQKRKIGGMSLSDKVWSLANQSKIESELARSIASGKSADDIASSMKELLRRPNELYRRVRDEFGTLHLSKNARAYNPGAGVYRSSFKNAQRLARTEINMAYRNAEQESYRDKDYVVGIEIKRSKTPYDCPVCAALAGKYPKDFKWSGWHPNCRCYMTPITLSDEEMDKWTDAILNGEDLDSTTSENYVGDVPEGFKDWVEGNSERISRAVERGTIPYFIRDNAERVAKSMLRETANADGLLSLADIRQAMSLDPDIITADIMAASGIYFGKRADLHRKIIGDYLRNGKAKSDTIYMLGGAPANGKSTLVDSGLLKHPKGSLVIDADKVKAMIPEYASMVASGDKKLVGAAANFVHEESSMLGKAIQEKAFARGLSVVIDGVNDGTFEKVQRSVARIKSLTKGKRIRADYVTLDTDLSLKLAASRAAKTGRLVPESVILGANKGIAEIIPEVIKNGTFDELYLWDTNVNGKPRLILKQIDGELTIVDQKLYDNFLKKAKA